MTETTIPLQRSGISLDADAVLAEIDEAPDAHGLTPFDAELITRIGDDEINAVIHNAAGDDFWAEYDRLRREAISRLKQRIEGR